jgi:hypothetical protein
VQLKILTVHFDCLERDGSVPVKSQSVLNSNKGADMYHSGKGKMGKGMKKPIKKAVKKVAKKVMKKKK